MQPFSMPLIIKKGPANCLAGPFLLFLYLFDYAHKTPLLLLLK